jgi:hypothetical protein
MYLINGKPTVGEGGEGTCRGEREGHVFGQRGHVGEGDQEARTELRLFLADNTPLFHIPLFLAPFVGKGFRCPIRVLTSISDWKG